MPQNQLGQVPDRVVCGFHDSGSTTEACRMYLIFSLFKMNNVGFFTNNQVSSKIMGYGLLPGRDYSGGGACHSAPTFAIDSINGQIQRPNNLPPHQIQPPIQMQRNASDTHRFAKDANGLLIDPTWRQFHRSLCKPDKWDTPGIFVGTLGEMKEITHYENNAKIDHTYTGGGLM